MVLGTDALLRGLSPAELVEWFHASFVDGYEWVMPADLIGRSQWADGGPMGTCLRRPPTPRATGG